MKYQQVVILGGGISGLTLAYRLQERTRQSNLPCEITVLEASSRFGGILETTHRDGFVMERGADSFITDKSAALDLAKELGLENELIAPCPENRRSFILKDGKLHAVPNGFYLVAPGNLRAFLFSSLLSFKGKMRVLQEIFQPYAFKEDESMADFVIRRFGPEAYEQIAQPMLGGIYSGDPFKLSLKATFPKFVEIEKHFGSIIQYLREGRHQQGPDSSTSGPRYGLFTTFKDGLQALPERLVEKSAGVRFLSDKRVSRVKNSNVWHIETEDGEHIQADILCCALPAPQSANLIRPFASNIAEELSQIEHESAVTINLVAKADRFPKRYLGFGFVVPQNQPSSLIGCTFSSLKWPGRAPLGYLLCRAFLGGAFQHKLLQRSDQELTQIASQELNQLLGIDIIPELSELRRYTQAMPQYQIGHLSRKIRVDEAIHKVERFHLLGNALKGVGIPDRIIEANAIADKVVEELRQTPSQAALV